MGHFSFINTGDTHNLIHELTFAIIVGTAAIGLFSQLFKPKENFAGQLVALTAWAVMILAALITNNWVPQPLFIIFGGLTLLATILHPAGIGLLVSFKPPGWRLTSWIAGGLPLLLGLASIVLPNAEASLGFA